jgi:hypothetical protein
LVRQALQQHFWPSATIESELTEEKLDTADQRPAHQMETAAHRFRNKTRTALGEVNISRSKNCVARSKADPLTTLKTEKTSAMAQ